MLDLLPFFMWSVYGCPYNDFVICKDSSDCLGKVPSSLSKMRFNLEFSCHKTTKL